MTNPKMNKAILWDDDTYEDRKLTLKYPKHFHDMRRTESDNGDDGFGDKASSAKWRIPYGRALVL